MQYLGGKSRIAKALAARIRELVPDATGYWDPFCGGLSMSVALSAYAPVLAADANASLIALYQAVRAGWVPPEHVTQADYEAAKTLPAHDPRKAFIGIGCAFSGKWFGGYARDPDRNYASAASRSVVRYARALRGALACGNWLTLEPRPLDAVLYLDPPYAHTTGYGGAPAWEPEAFYARVLGWCAHAHTFVSEHRMPFGYECWARAQITTVRIGRGLPAIERLYYLPKGSRW